MIQNSLQNIIFKCPDKLSRTTCLLLTHSLSIKLVYLLRGFKQWIGKSILDNFKWVQYMPVKNTGKECSIVTSTTLPLPDIVSDFKNFTNKCCCIANLNLFMTCSGLDATECIFFFYDYSLFVTIHYLQLGFSRHPWKNVGLNYLWDSLAPKLYTTTFDSGYKEVQFSSLPFGQAVARLY